VDELTTTAYPDTPACTLLAAPSAAHTTKTRSRQVMRFTPNALTTVVIVSLIMLSFAGLPVVHAWIYSVP
jgi:hypothetical protein